MTILRRALVAATAGIAIAASAPLGATQKGDKSKDKEQDALRKHYGG